MNILEMRNVTKRFAGVTAVNNLSLNLEEGSTVGIIGPNGAGKTTILNLISHIVQADSGSIVFNGTDITRMAQEKVARLGLARTFQNIRLFNELSVLDNVRAALDYQEKYTLLEAMLRLPRRYKGERRIREEAKRCLDVVGLLKYEKMMPGNLPYGLQRRLEIARALALRPKILMLDEPAAGLNPDEMLELIRFVRFIRETYKLSVLVIEHKMDFIMELCNTIYVQDFGNTIAVGTPDEIQNNEKVIAAYLGVES